MLTVNVLLLSLCADCFLAARAYPILIPIFLFLFIFVNIFPFLSEKKRPTLRLRICGHGVVCLKTFVWSAVISIIYHIIIAPCLFPEMWALWAWSAVISVLAHAVIFWNGMLCAYLASVQLGIRHRAWGLLCGFIPIANIIMLFKIIITVSEEVKFETEKIKLNAQRESERVCGTKYPILLVHGVFFRDSRLISYWGRIPAELEKNGAKIYFGNHQSAASVPDAAAEITERIKEIVKETGCEKVNIIAHSKGGLDCRYAIGKLGADKYTASLTTINTPHRGCEFADYLLDIVPQKTVDAVTAAYNSAAKRLGDKNPDFIRAVKDLTAGVCALRDKELPAPQGIFCQSVGSKLNRASNGKFPLNYTYKLVKYFDGPNDGLVSEKSFRWGEKYTFLTVNGRRGISHGDMVDLNRENIRGFDVREFYVGLVSELKNMGL